MRVRVVRSLATTSAQSLASEATARVARADESVSVTGLMRTFETVHDGHEEPSHPRAWTHRVVGPHRFTVLLEHRSVPLAYVLAAVGPSPCARMEEVFLDAWPRRADGDALWTHCSFYSINSLVRGGSSPYHGVPVGFLLLRKTAELLALRGLRGALQDRALTGNGSGDERDVAPAGVAPRLFTMSPLPGLAAYVERSRPALVARLREDPAAQTLEAAREELLALARQMVEERADPVAKFHLGNGARLHRLNWRADDSERRRLQSFGMMCNYDYNKD